MNAITGFYQFVTPIFFFLGIFGNIMGFVVMLKKEMKKIGARNIYRYLFITDSIFIIQLVVDLIFYQFSYDVTKLSVYTCNMYYYFSYTLASLSPMLLVYIAIERFISIKYPAKRLFLRRSRSQRYYFLLVIGYNMLFYLPFAFSFAIQSENSECDFANAKLKVILSLMDLINRVLLPCTLITLSTCLLIHCIFKSRHRVLRNYTYAENTTFKKDIKLTFTSIFLNIFYVLLTMPLPIFLLLNSDVERDEALSEVSFFFCFFLFYVSYCVNLFIIFVSNSLFRNQSMNLLTNKHKNNKYTKSVKVQNI